MIIILISLWIFYLMFLVCIWVEWGMATLILAVLGMLWGILVTLSWVTNRGKRKKKETYDVTRDDVTMGNEKIDEVLEKAVYVVKHARTSISIELPLSYFRERGFDTVRIYHGCGRFDRTGTVSFELARNLEVESKTDTVNFLFLSSKELPIEMAPDWLRETEEFRKAVREKVDTMLEVDSCEKRAVEKMVEAVSR